MNLRLVKHQAGSYALAGIFLSMLVTFIAGDLSAMRREAFLREDSCTASAMHACPNTRIQPLRLFRDL